MDANAGPFVRRDEINWTSVTAFTVFHVGAVAAPFFFSWSAFFTALALYWISLSLGIGMGYRTTLTGVVRNRHELVDDSTLADSRFGRVCAQRQPGRGVNSANG